MNIFSRISELADIKRVTMYQLSQETGISQSVFSRLKKDSTVKLNRKNLDILANYFCVNSEWLATGIGNRDAPGVVKDTKIHDEAIWNRIQDIALNLFSVNNTISEIDYAKMEESTGIDSKRLFSIIEENQFPTYTEILQFINSRINIDTNWLMTGNGEMLKKELETHHKRENISIDKEAWEVIRLQARSLERKDAQVDELIQIIKDKEKIHDKGVQDAECVVAKASSDE